ncbi:NUDIX domain-containing protein [Kitasatospora sp. NPDC088391]|uniref:NUDIX domain-containing protein n=1 Tax=Kitasatospora sp. NPDC088391 TaxID=3364074 RepID=UPI0037F8F936
MTRFQELVRQGRAEGIEAFLVGVVVLDGQGRVLMVRRRPEDRFGGLWEFPDGTPVTLTEHDAHRWAPLDDLPQVGGHHAEVLDHLRRHGTGR